MTDHHARKPGAEADPSTSAPASNQASPATPTQRDGTEATQIAEFQARIAELEGRWRRARADLDNLRKRVARDAEQQRVRERARAATEWLPVLDNLDLALEYAKADPGAIAEGVRAVRDQAIAVMERLGFPRQDDEAGQPFDPVRHEAVATVPAGDAPPGTVVQVVRPGYGDGEHQLRPAAVVATRSN
jgi:molecular chaperone GrpE